MLIVDPTDPTPIYAQIARAIRAEIAGGRLAIGAKLPTVRQLALTLRVNVNTVAKVYSQLERAGVLSARRGVGTFVREPGETSSAKPSAPERERMLHQLTERLLADAHAAGITLDDIIRQLESRRT
ncbi:MAG TPA: GntR family transcriptional regulator [Gemmatimonadaceae bacterium]|nr:GntR family transcriptional regulator [Gemmatimonadaceae bacterium]